MRPAAPAASQAAERRRRLLGGLREAVDRAGPAFDPAPRGEAEEPCGMLRDNLGKVAAHGRRADSIVRSVLAHSRERTVATEPGAWTEFTITLPRGVGLLVLVVGDGPDIAELFRQQFRRDLRQGRFAADFAAGGEAIMRRGDPADATARGGARCLRLDAAAAERLRPEAPAVAWELMAMVARQLAAQVRAAHATIERREA